MKKGILTIAGMLLTVSLVSAGTTVPVLADEETTLVYGSGDYTRINPAMDEHGEINILIFNGLTAHDGDNQVVPGLAESWKFDDATNTYTFHMAEDAKWQDGEPVTADDVKFTIEAIMDPDNGSENAPRDLSERCEESSAGEVEDCNQASDKESLRVWREIIWHQQKSIWILLWNNYQDWMNSAAEQ